MYIDYTKLQLMKATLPLLNLNNELTLQKLAKWIINLFLCYFLKLLTVFCKLDASATYDCLRESAKNIWMKEFCDCKILFFALQNTNELVFF